MKNGVNEIMSEIKKEAEVVSKTEAKLRRITKNKEMYVLVKLHIARIMLNEACLELEKELQK